MSFEMVIERDAAIPMRDGVVLRGDVYRPGAGAPVPTLVHRTVMPDYRGDHGFPRLFIGGTSVSLSG